MRALTIIYITVIVLAIMQFCLPARASDFQSIKIRHWLTNVCRRHLIADDPYEFVSVKTHDLTRWLMFHESRMAWMELYERLETEKNTLTEKEKEEIKVILELRRPKNT